MSTSSEYRRGVGIVLRDADGRIWMGHRAAKPRGVREMDAGWHMPQGGIDPGEEPRETVMRELLEEVGTNRATIVAEHPEWLTYDVPEDMRPDSWKGKYVGQIHKWFLLRFDGADHDINIETAEPEFDSWSWVEPDEVLARAVPFKRALYPAVLAGLLNAR